MPRGLVAGCAGGDRGLSTGPSLVTNRCAHRPIRGLSTGLTGSVPLGVQGVDVPTEAQAGMGVDAHGCSEAPGRGVGVRGPALMPAADFARMWK